MPPFNRQYYKVSNFGDGAQQAVHTSGSAPLRVYSSVWQIPFCSRVKDYRSKIGVDVEKQLACVENLDSDLVCARRFHLDILKFEWLACTPAHGSLALDDLSCSFRHDSSDLGDGVGVGG